jgi:hypothetical protein
MTRPDGPSPAHTAAARSAEPPQSAGHPGVAGNERLTALIGAVLLVLIVVEVATTASIRALMSVHIVVGVLLAGPLAVKIGSTGYRFVRYYTGSPAYRRKGPPRRSLRVLAPLLLATTLVLIGSGIGLLVSGPTQPGPLIALHNVSTVLWLPLIAIHAFAYVRQEPRLIADDWRGHPAAQAPGRGLRLGVSLGALLAGATAAILVLPAATPWLAWVNGMTEHAPAPLIAGLFFATLALLAIRPLRWK